jgi:hypothetical protein
MILEMFHDNAWDPVADKGLLSLTQIAANQSRTAASLGVLTPQVRAMRA